MERSRDEEDGEDNIVKVKLTEVQGLDGEWDKEVVGDKVLFIRLFEES